MRNREGLPDADGPLVRVELPDKQHVCAVVRGRVQERDGSWWYMVEVAVYATADIHGRLIAEPSPVTFTAPAAACTPIPGEDYRELTTWRPGRKPAWYVEQRLEATAPARWVVHRGDCHAGRGERRPADDRQMLAALGQDDSIPCTVCRPDRAPIARR